MPNQATLCIISGMGVPSQIGVEIVNTPFDKSIISTWNEKSTKYKITQYNPVMYHEGRWKLFLNFRERVTRIMNSLVNILEEDSDKQNFWSECITVNSYNKYTSDVTNSQGNEYDIINKYIEAGLNSIANFIFLHNAALK